ncbi:MAG: proline--tRNA ligase [Candidatus Micrarchaeota archaeon]|nr:proline--tRNA ligase [Candidatus Micrarchaeota archaeon]
MTAGKDANFPEWYSQVVLKAGLADYAPVKGSIAFRPESYEIWEGIQRIFDRMIKDTGHRNVYMPLLVPARLLELEGEHFEGFNPEVYWVTKSGNSDLGEKLAIRPTSETIFYYFFAKWIRSWRDLPMLLNQWCNVLRSEIKDTKPFTRTSEFLWQEGHTAHSTPDEAEKEVMMIAEFYRDVMENYLAIPVLVGKKSDREKFAGAVYTVTLEALMPDGKALQCGTSHYLGQNFSKPFGVKFLNAESKEENPYTTSWGISTRLLGGLVMTHGDDKGLIVPPKVAPLEIVIVPIYRDDTKDRVLMHSNMILKKLTSRGFRAMLDKRDGYTPGWKFNEWELRGVPLRIEIGPRDIDGRQVVIARRDTSEKTTVKEEDLIRKARSELRSIQKALFSSARKRLRKGITSVKSYDGFKRALEARKGFIRANWCGSDECERLIKEETGATCRLIRLENEKTFGKCVHCGKEAVNVAYFAKAY